MTVRRSVILSTIDRTFATLVRFGTLVVTARLLTPEEIGVSVIGIAVLGMAGIVRDFGGVSYLIQVDEPTPRVVQTVFTTQLLLTLPLALICFLLAQPAAEFYGVPGLREFLWVTVACFLLGPFSSPIYALLSRNLEFGRIALISAVSSLSYAATTIGLALAGFHFMSFAWATLVSVVLALLLMLFSHPNFPIYRLRFDNWQAVFKFGAFDSARNMLYYLQDQLPLLVLGRTLGAESVGLFQRAVTVSAMPTTTLLAGLGPVVLPAFASQARENKALADSFLKSLTMITALLWPATLWVFILADPIVRVLLGPQWLAMVPLVHILAAAYLIWFPVYVINPILIAAGGIRDTLMLGVFTIPVMIAIVSGASFFGLHAAAWSHFISIPFYVVCSMLMVKRRVPYKMSALIAALAPSAQLALLSAIAPALVLLAWGDGYVLSIPMALLAGALGVASWLGGLYMLHHPMSHEVGHLLSAVQRRLGAQTASR